MNRPIAIGLLALFMVNAQAQAPSESASEIPIKASQFATLGIATAPVVSADATFGARLPARVVIPPAQVRVVSAPQTGLVESLLVAKGDEVHAGQILAHVQSPELIALQRDYLQTLTQLHLAASDLKRDEELFKEGVIAKRRLLEKRSRHAELIAARDERRQALLLAGMLDEAIKELERSRQLTSQLAVCAPIDGVVMERMVTAGERVERIDPLYRLASLDPLWLEIRAPLNQIGSLAPGSVVEVLAPQASGTLILIGREVDPDSQTVLLRAEVADGSELLRPGQFVQARLVVPAGSGYSVASSALVRSADAVYVFVRTAQGFRAVPVKVISEQDGHAVVAGELKAREEVAVRGVSALKAAWLGLGGGQ